MVDEPSVWVGLEGRGRGDEGERECVGEEEEEEGGVTCNGGYLGGISGDFEDLVVHIALEIALVQGGPAHGARRRVESGARVPGTGGETCGF